MTPKEKAKELVDKIFESDHCGIKHQPNHRYCDCTEINYFQAKQCALIAVDEIIKSIPCREDYGGNGWILIDNSEYWQEVETEIEKL